ncbi:helix-turn-helix domain-containing protein [Streptomyces sp. N2-109]|uniref:Helix-turn-helix domain-containing protein n=1 Tax=Streptomyces gossypii TaxID=2883101 RepID=A0ABT2JPA1_9ACTN|nr:helix-turn-helix transcriptional regulator [Streptomyces gossypii]MCT2589195.1 helix-turn-helix domain-containing protein [Streptomyces gossypii]
MGQKPRILTPHAGPDHYLGAEMRDWRTHRGLSLSKLGTRINFSPSYMARAERGDQAASADLISAYDHALRAEGTLVRKYRRLHETAQPRPASSVHVSHPGPHVSSDHVPLDDETGIEAPSSEGISVPARTDDGRIIFVSISRRALLGTLGTAAAAAAFSDASAAAASPTSGTLPALNPIEHLKATRRVLIDNDNLFGPYQSIPIVERQMAAMKSLRRELRGTDRQQLVQLQTQYAELAGWFHQDAGNFRAAQHWTREGLELSHLSGDPELTTYILVRRSQLAGDMHDAIEALDVAEAAEDRAEPGSRLAAVAATFGAHGHALRGDTDACKRAYDHAHDLYQALDPNPASPWGVWLDSAYIEVHRAHSLSALGDHKAAIEGFGRAITDLPAGFHRDRGVYLARQAVALAGAGEAEQAGTAGLQALQIGVETGSSRITRELARLDEDLGKWHSVITVNEFQDAMRDAVLKQA